jgi:uncharacterized protein DUF6364
MALRKQNITLALDRDLLRKARAWAAHRGTSISAMLADELQKMVARESAYEQARMKAVALLDTPFHLGGAKAGRREDLHDRKGLR